MQPKRGEWFPWEFPHQIAFKARKNHRQLASIKILLKSGVYKWSWSKEIFKRIWATFCLCMQVRLLGLTASDESQTQPNARLSRTKLSPSLTHNHDFLSQAFHLEERLWLLCVNIISPKNLSDGCGEARFKCSSASFWCSAPTFTMHAERHVKKMTCLNLQVSHKHSAFGSAAGWICVSVSHGSKNSSFLSDARV